MLFNLIPYKSSTPPVAGGLALFGGGFNGTLTVATVDKYNFSSTVFSAGTNLGTARHRLAGFGNATTGYFACGEAEVVTDKYTYSTDVVVAGTSFSTAREYPSAFSNATVGILAGGSPTLSSTEKYTFSSDVVAAGTDSGYLGLGRTGFGNQSFGWSLGGHLSVSLSTVDTTKKYEYSTDVVTTTAVLLAKRRDAVAGSSSTKGLIAAGIAPTIPNDNLITDTTEVYNMSSDVWTASTVLSIARTGAASASNSATVLIAYGIETDLLASTDVFNLTTEAITPGTNVLTQRRLLAGASNSHGGV